MTPALRLRIFLLVVWTTIGTAAPEAGASTTSTQALEVATTHPPGEFDGQSSASETVTSEAARLLEKMRTAYASVQTLELTGTLTTDNEIGGRVEKVEKEFTSAFRSPAHFRHEILQDLVTGFTGDTLYLHKVDSGPVPLISESTTSPLESLPPAVVQVLRRQNPSLLLLLAEESLTTPVITQLRQGKEELLEGKRHPVLEGSLYDGRVKVLVVLDRDSYFIRQVRADLKPGLEMSGVAGVRRALYTIDYRTVRQGSELPDEIFRWTPPEAAAPAPPASPGEQTSTRSEDSPTTR